MSRNTRYVGYVVVNDTASTEMDPLSLYDCRPSCALPVDQSELAEYRLGVGLGLRSGLRLGSGSGLGLRLGLGLGLGLWLGLGLGLVLLSGLGLRLGLGLGRPEDHTPEHVPLRWSAHADFCSPYNNVFFVFPFFLAKNQYVTNAINFLISQTITSPIH